MNSKLASRFQLCPLRLLATSYACFAGGGVEISCPLDGWPGHSCTPVLPDRYGGSLPFLLGIDLSRFPAVFPTIRTWPPMTRTRCILLEPLPHVSESASWRRSIELELNSYVNICLHDS